MKNMDIFIMYSTFTLLHPWLCPCHCNCLACIYQSCNSSYQQVKIARYTVVRNLKMQRKQMERFTHRGNCHGGA